MFILTRRWQDGAESVGIQTTSCLCLRHRILCSATKNKQYDGPTIVVTKTLKDSLKHQPQRSADRIQSSANFYLLSTFLDLFWKDEKENGRFFKKDLLYFFNVETCFVSTDKVLLLRSRWANAISRFRETFAQILKQRRCTFTSTYFDSCSFSKV